MTTSDRLVAEQQFHDRQAADRAAAFAAGRADLLFADADYLDHETWVRPAFAKLGDLRGKSVLDYGCGHGMAAVVLARAGARVTAFDLSPGYVSEARERCRANGVRAECVVADGEQLPFDGGQFDAVWGNAILHHLDLAKAGRELRRVLKPGGVAVFCEPWGGNPLLAAARRVLPYPGKDRTPDERPLTRRDLAPLRDLFAVGVEGHQLLGMVRRVWPNRRLCRTLDALDARLLRAVPPAWNWCRYVVVTLQSPPSCGSHPAGAVDCPGCADRAARTAAVDAPVPDSPPPPPPPPPPDARRSAQLTLAVLLAVLVGLLAVRGYGHGLRTRPTDLAPTAAGFDLNRADAAELEQMPGVGPATARAILADRQARGPYQDADDLDRVPGVGPAAVGKVRPYLTVRAQSPPDDPPLPDRTPPPPHPPPGGKVRPGDPPVNVNTASAAELQRLPGVGPVTAANIVAGRPFKSVGELDRVPKIGPKTLEKLRPFVTVE